MTNIHERTQAPTGVIRLALGLSMGAAVSLGVTRFSYGLLLPPMRDDLGWSYLLAGSMNTVNALGYLLGALTTPALMRHVGAERLLISGSALATLSMACTGFFSDAAPLLSQRLLAGVFSAWVFVAGGLLAARLGTRDPGRSGLLLGIYYGGTGFGILLSALVVPPVLAQAGERMHAWAWAWWVLSLACAGATVCLAWAATSLRQVIGDSKVATHERTEASALERRPLRHLGWALAGYLCFGAGYIGYMTFVIALLKDQGASGLQITLFYSLLGVACLLSSRVWSRLLDRWHGGRPQALLNALLGVATLLPVVSHSFPVALVSGVLFGGVFLSVVASTTALVRHNLAPEQWVEGITAFTIVFAFGQIVGPTIAGWLADGPGGLSRGLVASACTLWLGAALAYRQRSLA